MNSKQRRQRRRAFFRIRQEWARAGEVKMTPPSASTHVGRIRRGAWGWAMAEHRIIAEEAVRVKANLAYLEATGVQGRRQEEQIPLLRRIFIFFFHRWLVPEV